jgi:cysteinyl-tRNA synthetase
MAEFGDTYDIHGGAIELIFPHHEAEIAQAESLTGKAPFVRYWIHTGLLNVGGRKMSKSLGNMVRIRDALKDYTPAALGFYFESVHYREPMVFSQTGLEEARRRLERLRKNFSAFSDGQPRAHDHEGKGAGKLAEYDSAFKRYMNDDFYTPGALKVLEEFANELAKIVGRLDEHSKRDLEGRFRGMAGVLGILS